MRIVLGVAALLVIFHATQWQIVLQRPETAFAINQEQKGVTESKRNESISTTQSQFQQVQSALEDKNAAVAVSHKLTLQEQLQQLQQSQQGDASDKQSQRHQHTPNIDTPFDCIVVFHIPKTGGSSFQLFLRKVQRTLGWKWPDWYTYRERHHETPPSKLTYNRDKFMVHHHVIHMGHLTPSFLKETSTEHCLTITMLREPIDRVISAFYYHGHKTPEWESCLKNDTTCQYAHQYQNDNTRIFSANETWNAYNIKTATKVDRKHLQKAQQFLSSVDLLCFLDHFEDCQRDFLAMTNLTHAIKIPATSNAEPVDKVNVGKNRRNVTAAMRYNIESVNELDIELYEWAAQKFHGKARQRRQQQ
jgi:hypothetical protein